MTIDSTCTPANDDDRDAYDSFAADAAFAYLHYIYRCDISTLQVAIAHATGEQRRRLEIVLSNLRKEQRR